MGNYRVCSVWLAAGTLFVLAAAANAQTARTGGGASAQLLQQMQQLASERTTLQAENAQMKKELDGLRKERDALKDTLKKAQQVDGRVKAGEEALARTAAQRESTEQELKQTKERMQELIAKFRETIQTMREIETERSTATQTLAAREHDLKVCFDHNAALYKLNEEVLNRLEHQATWSRMATIEPFTKIKRAQLENLVDDYKARADDQRLKSAPAPVPTLAVPVPPAVPDHPQGPPGNICGTSQAGPRPESKDCH